SGPIRKGMTTAFGSSAPKVALGVALRHDWGSQYTANTFVNEIKCWGFTDTPAFVGKPECNRCAERFMRTLKEQCLYLHQFRDLEEPRAIIGRSLRATTRSGSSNACGTGRPPRRAGMRSERLHERGPHYRPGRGAGFIFDLPTSRIGRVLPRPWCPRNRLRYRTVLGSVCSG